MMLASLLLAFQGPDLPMPVALYRAQVAAAESAMRLDELAVARSWLDETAASQRGFEWRVHDAALEESLASYATGATHAYTLDVSPDGGMLALGMTDGAVALRRTADGVAEAEIGRHTGVVSYARFSADGKRLVTASHDRTVKVWDVAARKLLVDFTAHHNPVAGAAFSPDGALVASCSYERDPKRGVYGIVHLWNAADGTLVRTLEGGRKPVVGIEFSPDGKRLAAGSWDFCVFVWNVEGGAPIQCAMPDEGIYNGVDDAAWTADGRFVIGASKDRTARVWNAATGELVASLRGHTDSVHGLALSADGALLSTASGDGVMKLWNTSDWSLRATLRGHHGNVVACAFAPDGQRLYSSSKDRTVRVWDATTTAYGGDRHTAVTATYMAQYSPDDSLVATAGWNGRIELRSGHSMAILRSWQAHPDGKSCHALAWTPDGKRLVSGSWEPVLRVWNVEDGKELASFVQDEGTNQLAISPDGAYVASCAGKKVLVWDLAKGTKVHEFTGHGSTVLAVNFSPDSSLCLSGARDGKAMVWQAATGAPKFAVPCADSDVAEAMFTPDGKQFVVAGRSGSLTLHDASNGSLVRNLARLRHGLDHIDISPDGTRLACASHVIALIDLQHGSVVGELRPHREHPYNLDFDSRGLRLLSCSTDKTIVVSDTRLLRDRLLAR